jgi:hypothetical protein
MEAYQTELKACVKVEMVFDMSAGWKEQDSDDLFRAFQFIEDFFKIRRPPEILRFLVVIHARRTRKNRILTAHGVQRYAGPFALVIRSWLGSGGHIPQNLKVAYEQVGVVISWQPDGRI